MARRVEKSSVLEDARTHASATQSLISFEHLVALVGVREAAHETHSLGLHLATL